MKLCETTIFYTVAFPERDVQGFIKITRIYNDGIRVVSIFLQSKFGDCNSCNHGYIAFLESHYNSTVMTSSSTAWKVNQKIRTRKSSNTGTRHVVSIFYISVTLIGLLSFLKSRLSPCSNEVIAFSQIHVTLHEWRVISLQINLNLCLLPTFFS